MTKLIRHLTTSERYLCRCFRSGLYFCKNAKPTKKPLWRIRDLCRPGRNRPHRGCQIPLDGTLLLGRVARWIIAKFFANFNFLKYFILWVLCAGSAKTVGKKTSKIFFGENLNCTWTKNLQPFKECSTAPQDVKPSFFHFRAPKTLPDPDGSIFRIRIQWPEWIRIHINAFCALKTELRSPGDAALPPSPPPAGPW